MKDITLSIIIVNYNVKEFLQNLLSSIQKSIRDISSEIIVIDNASDDGSVEMIREKYPYVNLISNNKNVGFGVANNQGLQIAKGKFFLLLNPFCMEFSRRDFFYDFIKWLILIYCYSDIKRLGAIPFAEIKINTVEIRGCVFDYQFPNYIYGIFY